MKCQNCGKNEINFHYSSNVNGCVTEAHLCSECAAKSGYDIERLFDTESLFDSVFSRGFSRAFLPMPMFGFGLLPTRALRSEAGLPADECGCGCETKEKEATEGHVDEDMQKRREINAIREQMRLAAESEDYEKAAELRDRARQMEA